MNIWKQMLANIPFDASEQKSVDRFLSEPKSHFFLPVYEILRSRNFTQEAFELLNWGQNLLPEYSAARVCLARELYERGQVADCFDLLRNNSASLKVNVLAQKLLLKSSLLCGYGELAKQTLAHMKKLDILDRESKKIADAMELDGVNIAISGLMKTFVDKNIPLYFSDSLKYKIKANTGEYHIRESLHKPIVQNKILGKYLLKDPKLKNYVALPLDKVFDKNQIREQTYSGQQKEIHEKSAECEISFYKKILGKLRNESNSKFKEI